MVPVTVVNGAVMALAVVMVVVAYVMLVIHSCVRRPWSLWHRCRWWR